MASIAESWDKQADNNAIVRFIDMNLRGAGQVMFQNNPLTGLLFLGGIFWGAYAAGMIQVGIGALVGACGRNTDGDGDGRGSQVAAHRLVWL